MMETRNVLHRTRWVALVAVLSLVIAACGDGNGNGNARRRSDRDGADRSVPTATAGGETEPIRLVYPEWSSEIASAHLFQAVLQERLGVRVDLLPVDVEEMWRRVAEGRADVLVGAWLPATHRDYLSTFGEDLTDLGPNLSGARIGLLVPTTRPGRQTDDSGKVGQALVTIDSIPQLADHATEFGGRVVGIESGAGVVGRSRDALEAYGLRDDFRIVTGTEEAMVDRLETAVFRGEWVVVTGWSPHWVFERYSLRFLDDPRGVFGGPESIHTMVRRGFAQDRPIVATVLDDIAYQPEDLERLMRWIEEDPADDPYGQALRWIRSHDERVDQWVKGAQ